jgi:isopenicillin N synthase-like dioxygenase
MATVSSSTTSTTPTPTYKLQLASGEGPVYRDVLKTPARDCHPSEVPVIDLARINGSAEERAALAQVIRAAAENTGFFYITNHGIPEATIAAAHSQAQTFFNQPVEAKAHVSQSQSKHFNGWSKRGTARISPTEPRDHKEGFTIAYDPKYDPDTKDLDAVPEDIKPWIHGEDFVWEGTSHLPGFKEDVLGYWQAQVQLARRMIRLFALALDVPEDYFDSITSYPGRFVGFICASSATTTQHGIKA